MFSDVYLSFLQNIGSNNFTRLHSSLFTHKTSKERHRMHAQYADTSVLQTLCVDSALRLELCKERRTNFACSIVSLVIYLLLTKITRDYAQK